MEQKFTLEMARAYAQEMETFSEFSQIRSKKLASALSTLAEETFRVIVDITLKLADTYERNHQGFMARATNPLQFLEIIRRNVDCDISSNLTSQVPEQKGITRTYLNKLYGEHFYND